MKLLSMTVRSALRALRRNKLRSSLTMLGIIIGVAAVIATVSIGKGADAAMQQQIRSLGTNLVMVVPGATTAAGVRSGWGGVSTLTVGDARALREECDALAEVTHFRRQVMQVQYGNQNWSTAVQGTTTAFLRVTEWPIALGRAFNLQEEAGAARVALLGRTVADQLFGDGHDPVGATIRVKNVPLQVIGVLEEKGQSSWGQDRDDLVVIPFSTAERRVLGAEMLGMVDMIQATAVSSEALGTAAEQIRIVLQRRHRVQAGEEEDFTVRRLDEMARASETASRIMTNLLLGVAGISLLVGGIGIMNILLVSVTERTREIGIRMAVGAKSKHILLQFLVESITLSLVGGIAGVGLGVAVSAGISRVVGWPTLLSPGAIAGALAFASAVGVFFGFYPAHQASRLDPITALRYE